MLTEKQQEDKSYPFPLEILFYESFPWHTQEIAPI